MGLQDRDYYRQESPASGLQPSSAVTIIMGLTAAVWLVQVALMHSSFRLEEYLACSPADLFEGKVWQILTANFLHKPQEIGHILGNMLFLFFFGVELEVTYGRRRFLTFYLTAGSVAMLAEASFRQFLGDTGTRILGASGAVMGTVVLFTLIYPRREFLVLLLRVPAWLLCSVFVFVDLLGVVSTAEGGGGVAFLAHLAGAGCGVLYRFWGVGGSWMLRLPRLRFRRAKRPAPRRPRPAPAPEPPPPRAVPREGGEDVVSARIDELLEKISRSGRESLTPDELDYLQKNSSRYRSKK